jgi:hypothetical protein
VKGKEKKTFSLSFALPTELPFRSTKAVPKKEDPSKFFSSDDLLVAQLLPSSCRCKDFDISYHAKISVAHDTIFALEKASEQFGLNLFQCS